MAEIHRLVIRPDFSGSNSRGHPYETIHNFKAICRAHSVAIRYNEIRKELDINIPGKNYLPDNYLNCCIAELTSLCAEHCMGSRSLMKFIVAIADENKTNPAKEWIESKTWDGVSRLDKFYATLKSTNETIKKILIQRWMISAIAALYEPYGVSAGGMLVLVGRQYLGKTNWFKNLVPNEQRNLIADGMNVDPRNRDSFMTCLEHWLVELGEIDATFKRADLAALKAFINRDKDITRLSYAAANSRFPRRTVFFGSVDKRSYLTDPAGNRRFWTIECNEIDHTHGLDMQQIWAEFKVLYDNKEPWLLSNDEHVFLTESNQEFETVDPMEEKIISKYSWELPIATWKTATQILEDLGYKSVSKRETSECSRLIRKHNNGLEKRNGKARLLALPPTNF